MYKNQTYKVLVNKKFKRFDYSKLLFFISYNNFLEYFVNVEVDSFLRDTPYKVS